MSADQLFSVEDQVVWVSGGTRGIGKAIAKGFAERGAKVTISGRDKSQLNSTANELGGNKHPVNHLVCDVADAKQIQTAISQVYASNSNVDTLINVAGINRRKPTVQITDEDYDDVMNINMRGAFLLSRDVGKRMLETGKGNQINVTSLNNERPLKNIVPYAASKAAMGQMTRALAMEWGPAGIRVNAIAPGFILTDLTTKLWSNKTMQAWNEANCPQKRLGNPDDLIGTAIFLASPASAFMTGQILYVDGGFTAGWPWPIPESGGQ